MDDYQVAVRTGVCAATQRHFEPAEEFYAVLFETAEGFERRDYGLDSWAGPPDGFFSFWKSRIPETREKKQLFISPEALTQLFVRLGDSREEVKKHFRFVLSLILMRKRLLKYQQTSRRGDSEYWRMLLVRDQSTHEVLNPKMTDEQIENVSRELGAILHGDTGAFARLNAEEADAQAETKPGEDAT